MNKNLFEKIYNNASNNYITTYYNFDISSVLSIYNLNTTLNCNRNITNNALVFNIEDNNILNIFKENTDKYSYNLNNVLFINNENQIHQLSYNLLNLDKFSIDKYNNIKLNINNNNIYINDNKLSSNQDKLSKLNINTKGIYKISDLLYLDNDKLRIQNYSLSEIYDKFNTSIIFDINNSFNTFGNHEKFKNIYYNSKLTNNDEFYDITYAQNGELIYKDKNICKRVNFKNELWGNKYYVNTILNNNIEIYDTDYFIIDLPIIYKYKGYIYKNENSEININNELCPINIDDISIKINPMLIDIFNLLGNNETHPISNSKIINYIDYNNEKSYVYNDKIINIIKKNNNYIISKECRISLYFNINSKINNVLQNIFKYIIPINIYYKNTELYSINRIKSTLNGIIVIKKSNNHFKKLYHCYNYGFNFDKHGECIGLLAIPEKIYYNSKIKNTNQDDSNSIYNSIYNEYNKENPHKKSVFINYNEYNIDNIFIPNIQINKNILLKNLSYIKSFLNININYNNSNNIDNYKTNINNYKNVLNSDNYHLYTQKSNKYLNDNFSKKCITYKQDNNNKYSNKYINKYSLENIEININNENELPSDGFIFPTIFYNYGYEENNTNDYNVIDFGNNFINSPYFLDNKEVNKELFENVYNYRKTGLQYGDFYTPSVHECLILKYFDIKKYFTNKVYNQYLQNNYEFITNQFYYSNGQYNNFFINKNNQLDIQSINYDNSMVFIELHKNNIYELIDKCINYGEENIDFLPQINNQNNTNIYSYKWIKYNYDGSNWNPINNDSNNPDPNYKSPGDMGFYEITLDTSIYYIRDYENQYYGSTETYDKFIQELVNQLLFEINEYNRLNKYLSTNLNNSIYSLPKYVFPLFKLPDFSIINSTNYNIVFDENENCEILDYYINKKTKYIYINYKDYKTNTNNINKFNLLFNNFQCKLIETKLIDKINNIYTLKLHISSLQAQLSKLTIYYEDSEYSLNNINNINENNIEKYYRILCKIDLKIES